MCCVIMFVFVFKQKTAYEMRISDWSSDVCSSDLLALQAIKGLQRLYGVARFGSDERAAHDRIEVDKAAFAHEAVEKGLADTIARGETPQRGDLIGCIMIDAGLRISRDRKSTRLNSSP